MQPNYGYQQTNPSYGTPINSRATIPGRLIGALEEVVPNEVPMDGSVGLFPMRDFSAIYMKAWNSDGTIKTITYVPKTEEQIPVITNDQIMDRLDRIEKLLDNRNRQLNQKKELSDGH